MSSENIENMQLSRGIRLFTWFTFRTDNELIQMQKHLNDFDFDVL